MEEFTEEINETSRKLASIQRILALEPIPGADRIETATILGWKVVVEKGKYRVGQLVVYAEIDSLFPARPEYEFLSKTGYRIKTIRLKQQVSQGIVFPLSVLKWNDNIKIIGDEVLDDNYDYINDMWNEESPLLLLQDMNNDSNPAIFLAEGTDVTEWIGVTKYEPVVPAQLRGVARGGFPSWLHKTDECRIQAIPDLLERHIGTTIRGHEKLDGSSCTMYIRNGDFGVCSRNLNLKHTEGNSFWEIAMKFQVEAMMKHCFPDYNFAIQGELIGPGIQGNKYNLRETTIRLFNVFDIDKDEYLHDLESKYVAQQLGLEWCPWVMDYVITENTTVEELLLLAQGPSALNPNQEREGLVWRPLVESKDDKIGRFSFKTISNKFLLKNGE